ncbi:MAG: histidine--tRNA ligase [Candidatus Aenigmatarchaeota archaeon]
MTKFQIVKGMRDFLPKEAILREKVFEKIKKNFERFGFSPSITPSLEYYEVFANKYGIGEENLKNIYHFEDKSGRKLALRFDQTVPLARLMGCNPQIPKPFKRYEISRVWRYEEIKRGRYREFWQCDIDIVGSKSMLADAEVIVCAIETVKELGFKDIVMKINNRKLLSAVLKYAKVKVRENDVLRIIDKLDKIGQKGVEKELLELGLKKDEIKKIFDVIMIKGKFEDTLNRISFLKEYDIGREGIEELKKLFDYLKDMVEEKHFSLDLSLARGLDYYTSNIFELSVEDKTIGSIAGGGRYDQMIGKFVGGNENIPAVGIALGVERIIELLKEKEKSVENVAKIFIANVSEDNRKDVIRIAKILREKGINTEIDLMERNLSRQLDYANKCKIPFVLIVGDVEAREGKYKLKDMVKGTEISINISQLVDMLLD